MRSRTAPAFVFAAVLFAVALLFGLCSGAAQFTVQDFQNLITGNASETAESIFWQIRFPRIAAAFAVGASLALAGTVMQSVFANPLVEPYTLGLSGAASLGMALSFLFKLPARFGSWVIPAASFAGILPILFFLLSIGKESRFGMKTVLLSGVMISYVSSSLVTLILTASDLETMGSIVQWGFGSLSGSQLSGALILAVFSFAVMVLLLFFSLALNALSLGENESRSVGVSPELWRLFFLTASALLTASAAAVGGVIGFVGLLVPHILRMTVSRDNRVLIPLSWLCGGTAVLLADTFGRVVILPREIPVGVIMGIVGGILFFVLIQKKSEAL